MRRDKQSATYTQILSRDGVPLSKVCGCSGKSQCGQICKMVIKDKKESLASSWEAFDVNSTVPRNLMGVGAKCTKKRLLAFLFKISRGDHGWRGRSTLRIS